MYTQSQKIETLSDNLSENTVDSRSLWRDAVHRFSRNKAAMAGLVVLSAIILIVIIGPYFQAWNYEQIDWSVMGNAAEKGQPSIETGHYFGTDDLGRDIYARTIYGSQVSLMVGTIGALIAMLIGTLYGATAGYFGGRLDSIMMRIVDILMAFPFMIFLIILLVIFSRSLFMIFVGVGAISWLDMSRIVRGQTLSLKNKVFIEAAVVSGVGPLKIIMRHIIPNLLGVVVVYTTLLVPQMILAESFISFLGLGVQEPQTSWGALISEGADTIRYGTLWQLLFPLGFFVATLLSFFFVGDGLRDALDPKDR